VSAKRRQRRSPGDGGLVAYETKSGTRYRLNAVVTLANGSTKRVFMRKGPNGEIWTDIESARAALRAMLSESDKGTLIEPSQQPFGTYCAEVIEGMRIAPQTRASYVKNLRNHIEPYPIARVPLARLTGQALTSHYRKLETSGRKDHKAGEGLSARTVRYLHTIIHGILRQAIRDGLLTRNPADAATPPSAKEAKPPEMQAWTAGQLAAFLRWAESSSQQYTLWHLLAMTGMRRGEALALRWRDVDLDAGTVSVRRSAGMVRTAGEGAEVVEGDTKTGKPRVIDIDAATVTLLRSHRKERGSMALQLARDDALVFGNIEGEHRKPEHVSRQFVSDLARCRKALGADTVPVVRLYDLRH
jgi:integrase